MGDPATAARLAGEVIDAVNVEDGSAKFRLGNEANARNGELTFPSEHLFAVHNSRAQEVVTPLFLQHSVAYTQDSTLLRDAYERVAHPNDIRFRDNRLWQTRRVQGLGNGFNYFRKYVENDQTAVDIIPVIRLAEMYFIAIENGDLARFPAYREARNLFSGLTLDPGELLDRLEKEYRKEFYGEGQMFYFYKRHAYARFTWPDARDVDVASYKLPRPETQTLFE
jgi:hypothetical protein